jgi:NADH-quinone oxidoreductase subunit A
MLRTYLPVLLLLGFVILNAVLILGIAHLTTKAQPTAVKSQPYESGINPLGDARDRFSVKFYLVAMLFIVFDIEIVFLYPWAVVYRDLKWFGFVEMLLFVVLVLAGFFYIWKKGVLDWSQAEEVERKAAAGLLRRTGQTLEPEKVTHAA